MQHLEIKITGRVQGVGFRYFVHHMAGKYNIKGWVRNTFDGGVEILAEGSEGDLANFIGRVKQGPSLARIENVFIDKSEDITGYKYFEVRF